MLFQLGFYGSAITLTKPPYVENYFPPAGVGGADIFYINAIDTWGNKTEVNMECTIGQDPNVATICNIYPP